MKTLVAEDTNPEDPPELCSICGESIRAGDNIVQPNMQDVAHAVCVAPIGLMATLAHLEDR